MFIFSSFLWEGGQFKSHLIFVDKWFEFIVKKMKRIIVKIWLKYFTENVWHCQRRIQNFSFALVQRPCAVMHKHHQKRRKKPFDREKKMLRGFTHTIVWRVRALTSSSQTSVPTAWWMVDFPNWIKFQLKIYIFLRRIQAFVYPPVLILLFFLLLVCSMPCYSLMKFKKKCLCWCGNFHFAMVDFCQRTRQQQQQQKKLHGVVCFRLCVIIEFISL